MRSLVLFSVVLFASMALLHGVGSGAACSALSIRIMDPAPDSALPDHPFYLKLEIVLLERISLHAVHFMVSFDGSTIELDSLDGFENLALQAVSNSSKTALKIEAVDTTGATKSLCITSAQYYRSKTESVHLPSRLKVAISLNNMYARQYFVDFFGAVLPNNGIDFVGLEQVIEISRQRPPDALTASRIDIMIVGPLDHFDCAPGSHWNSANRLIGQLSKMLCPRTVWIINGEGIGLSNLEFSSRTLECGASNDDGKVHAVFSTVTGGKFLPRAEVEDWKQLPLSDQPLFIYLPTAASSFSEMSFVPTELLQSAAENGKHFGDTEEKRKDVVYMYSRCLDRRESFFSKLKDALGAQSGRTCGDGSACVVDAAGACQGVGVQRDAQREQGRTSSSYLRDAISVNSNYRFVVAIENTDLEGYITEKLTNAYIAGAVPIYRGAPDVHKYFSEESMINCNVLSEDECVALVVEVARNNTRYDQIRNAPGMTKYQWELFFESLPLFARNKDILRNKYAGRIRQLLYSRIEDSQKAIEVQMN